MLIHPHPARLRLPAALAVATALLVSLLVSGCSEPARTDAPEAGASSRSPDATTILQPGEPGEPAATVGPEEVPPGAEWNHADVAFMQMMVPHHAQALEMAKLADTRTRSSQVKALARRISGAQGPEIITLAAWLQERDIEVPRAGDHAGDYDHSKHGHTDMAGMLTPGQMNELRRARDRRFDRLFLEGMVDHHAGAVEMAETVAVEGSDLQVSEIAADVAVGQAAEIGRMQELLRDL